MIERGLEGIMKPAKLKEIWSDALRGTAWPSILTIKLIDPSKDVVGRLSLVDLLHPRFSSLLNSSKDKCYHSFQKLGKFFFWYSVNLKILIKKKGLL